VRVTPVLAGCHLAEAVAAVGLDISLGGVGFLLPGPLPTADIYVCLPWLTELSEVSLRAHVVRGRARPDGWYEIGAAFPTDI
jgi:PilZ domain-containing protein